MLWRKRARWLQHHHCLCHKLLGQCFGRGPGVGAHHDVADAVGVFNRWAHRIARLFHHFHATDARVAGNGQTDLLQHTDVFRNDPASDGKWITSEFYVATAASKGQAVAATLDLLDDEGFRAAYAGRDGHLSEWTDGWSTVTVMAFSMEEGEFWELFGWTGSTVIHQALATWAPKNGRLAVQLLKAARAGGSPGHLAVAGNQGVVGAVERYQLEHSVRRQEAVPVSCGVKRL